ncbi:conserved virulence factor C family protein [Piscibacillus halophilus]|uniref:HEAT repeat-containing protein n=1 Tax=Piscibacillus halophilus TaxID=571933 RepID=A0A1H9J2H7_9BACI|nr:conserved virulence factor C family protein [Piscibacillus halophilus]SEQ81090.1 HEAT repeat-containing protein [Piscibacillus halophilus]
MRIVSIEPTPSPYSMKINLNESLPNGQTEEYKQNQDLSEAPDYVKKLFAINGVKELYRVIDFIALERNPKVPWEEILPKVKEVLGSDDEGESTEEASSSAEENFGEIKVFIQKFKHIPMQVKVEEDEEEKRFGLDNRFMEAVMEASKDADLLEEREWVEQNPRYGDGNEIGQDVVAEIEASYDQERLNALVKLAMSGDADHEQAAPQEKLTIEALEADDWKERYAALDRMPNPTVEDLPALDKALDDPKMSVRRLATAYLGEIEDKAVLPYIYKALNDKTVTVRRTAGDCLSDLGYTEAIPKMIEALKDSSRIVRWRAAMFLYEYGDETALPALADALEDPEFEVRMQAKMALSRIQGGEEAKGSIWKQMMDMTKEKKK